MNNLEEGNCVYIIRGIGTGFYKIGLTTNINDRLAAIQALSPSGVAILVLHYTDHHAYLEEALHNKFDDIRRDGSEWFKLSQEHISFLSQETHKLLAHFPFPPTIQKDKSEGVLSPYSVINLRPRPGEETPEIDGETDLDNEKEKEYHEFFDGLLPELRGLYEELGTWQKVADHYGISKEWAWNIGVNEIEPGIAQDVRKKIGLSTYVDATHTMPDDIE